MLRNNVPEGETRNITIAVIVEGGIDTAISHKILPAKYVNMLDDVLEKILDYCNREKENE